MPSFATVRVAASILIAATVFTFAGCEQKDVAAEFEKVQNGMTLSQVEKLLGSGNDETPSAGYGVSSGGVLDSKASNEKTYVWRDGGKTFTIVFKDGKVVQKQKAGQ